MIPKQLLIQIILDQQNIRLKDEVARDIQPQWLESEEIVVVSGVRRCGKSVLIQQMRKRMKEQDFFLNFDDDRLIKFTIEDFQLLQECLIELFGVQHTYYFDEIQNIKGWELFVRRLYNSGNKIFITGSNANMLSRELGTHLTGRYIAIELYPFSFKEFLTYNKIEHSTKTIATTVGTATMLAQFKRYMKQGGFPAFLRNQTREYISGIYESIIYRDVLLRNGITNEREVLELMHYLASNAAKRHTYSSLGKVVGLKHPETIKNYLNAISDTYLIFQLTKYAPSVKTQSASAKKIYLIDNAIISTIGFNPTDNIGILLENLVFIELKRRQLDVYYYANKGECDFVVRRGVTLTEAYQVTMGISEEKTKQREMKGLIEVAKAEHTSKNYILTMDEECTITEEGLTIEVKPIWKWLLDQPSINQTYTQP